MQHLKMYFFITLLDLTATSPSVLARPRQTANLPANSILDYGNIEDNLVEDYDLAMGEIRPPKPESLDYYSIPRAPGGSDDDGSLIAVIDTVRKVVQVPRAGGSSEEKKLKVTEEEDIKRLTYDFANKFGEAFAQQSEPVTTGTEQHPTTNEAWKKLNPIITLSKSGVTLAFGNVTDESEEPVTSQDDDQRDPLWSGLAASVGQVFGNESSNGTARPSVDDGKETGFSALLGGLWDILSSSASYIANVFSELFAGESGSDAVSAATEESRQSTPSSTTIGVFALEEPTGVHSLPSHEFEKRGRDIDSLLYGHGIA